MTNGGEDSRVTTQPEPPLPAPPARTTTPNSDLALAGGLQDLIQPAHQPARTATPLPPPVGGSPSKQAEMVRTVGVGKANERFDTIERTVREIKDVLDGLKEQFTALVERMDAAGRKDDEHDGELVGLKAGLKDAEDGIRFIETTVVSAQKAADVACKRLVEEFGEY